MNTCQTLNTIFSPLRFAINHGDVVSRTYFSTMSAMRTFVVAIEFDFFHGVLLKNFVDKTFKGGQRSSGV